MTGGNAKNGEMTRIFLQELTDCQAPLFAHILVLCSNDRDFAWDVLQETNLYLCAHAAEYTPARASLYTWACAVAWQKFRKSLQDATRRQARFVFSQEELEKMLAASSGIPPSERLLALRRCLAKLSGGDLALLRLHYAKQEPLVKIAEREGANPVAIRQRMCRLRKALGECVEGVLCKVGSGTVELDEDEELIGEFVSGEECSLDVERLHGLLREKPGLYAFFARQMLVHGMLVYEGRERKARFAHRKAVWTRWSASVGAFASIAAAGTVVGIAMVSGKAKMVETTGETKMKKTLVAAAAAIVAQVSQATTWYVSPNGDNSDGKSWETAFNVPDTVFNSKASGNDTILLDTGEYQLSAPLAKNGSLTMRGRTGNPADVVIRAKANSECMRTAGAIKLYDMTFCGGTNSSLTGGIRLGGGTDTGCILSNCVVTGCSSQNGAAVIIYPNNKAIDCVFSNNTATVAGGAIQLLGGVTALATNCLITGNTAPKGGGVLINQGTLAGCTVTANKATNNGGGVFLNNENAILTNCFISANTSQYSGGGIYLEKGTVVDCIVSNNVTTASDGGGAQLVGDGAILRGGIVCENRSQVGWGGGVDVLNQATLVDAVISNNYSALNGGGVRICGPGSVVSNCVIVANSGKAGGGACGYGTVPGGRIFDCRVVGNTAWYDGSDDGMGSGGGLGNLWLISGCYIAENCVSNHHGGGIRFGVNGQGMVITNSVICNNTVTNGHGAGIIMLDGSGMTLVDSIVSNNVAVSSGGQGAYSAGMHIQGAGTSSIRNCDVVNNRVVSTSNHGGGIRVDGNARVRVENCTIARNEAPNSAGLCITTKAKLELFDSIIEENKASTSGSGGGCRIALNTGVSENCVISNCVFRNNRAAYGAGLAGPADAPFYASVYDCVFTNNTATMGGGVYVREDTAEGPEFLLRNCLIADNHLVASGPIRVQGGGVYFVSRRQAMIDSCTIVGNDAGELGGGICHRWGGTVINSIIAFNTLNGVSETRSDWALQTSSYNHCCVWPANSYFSTANGCINADPRFTDMANGDYTLQRSSPCKNAGIVEEWMTDAKALNGVTRVHGPRPDIGCYEIIYPAGFVIQLL